MRIISKSNTIVHANRTLVKYQLNLRFNNTKKFVVIKKSKLTERKSTKPNCTDSVRAARTERCCVLVMFGTFVVVVFHAEFRFDVEVCTRA